MIWEKQLSKSDAQQPTKGSKMPFLRLTRGDTGVNHITWFRKNFFAGLNWQPGTSQRGRPVEEATVNIRCVILGVDHGIRQMRLDHDANRANSHSAPATHLHYDHHTRAILEAGNFTEHTVRLMQLGGGYRLEIL